MNLNRLFRWLSIRNKLLIAFAGLSILPLAFVGVYSILSNVRMMKNVALQELTEDVQNIREKSENFLENIYLDLQVLENSSSMETWMRQDQHGTLTPSQTNTRGIAAELLDFARTKGMYYQLRVIGENGDELVRIENDHPNDSTRNYRIVPFGELRRNREAYYFLLINGVDNHQLAFAPAELVNRYGERIPVISFAMPLVIGERRVGILIGNVFERNLIDVIRTKEALSSTRTVVLATGDGHFVYRSDMQKDWDRLLASRDEDDLRRHYPAVIVDSILSGKDGTITEGTNNIVSYAPLFGKDATARGIALKSSFAVPIIVLESESSDVVFSPVRAYTLTYLVFLVLFLLSAVTLGLVATRQITRPIAELQRGAEVIAQGNYAETLKVETHDEIELLADRFNTMAAALRTHEAEIERHRTQLEEMVKLRTQELQEEKGKLQAVLDNVPSAFVLLDPTFRIQTVSAAFGSVTGIASQVMDKSVPFELVGDADGRTESPWSRAALTGEIESLVQRINGEGHSPRYLEYIAIPVKEGTSISATIVIISDITKRKNFEEQLVHTEKLAAAGEMSSIIAHEFRNALTSVKMILQLLVESENASRSEKKSLAVALDSIYHMETVVTELLDFARPKPVQLLMTDLNKIVQECLEFVAPHVQRQHVNLTKSLDTNIKRRPLDASRMKEAVINLLLNSIQAQDGQGITAKEWRIIVTTKQVKLKETMRDIAYAESLDQPNETQGRSEIVLKKNSECAVIEVCDNGKGIAKDELRRIFDPFFTTKTNGTGLGLPMVKRTVMAHGGVVTVESVPGEGTMFTIYLPTSYAG